MRRMMEAAVEGHKRSLDAYERYGSLFTVLVIALCVLLYIPSGAFRDFWAPDEPRFAQVSQEMLDSDDWVVPRMNGQPVALLPPLTYWLVGAFSVPFGKVTEFSARLSMAIVAILAVLATYQLGRLMFDRLTGFLSAIVLATCAGFYKQALWLQADMVLITFVTLTLVSFYFAYRCKRHSAVFYTFCYVCGAFGTLAKGPVAAVLPGLIAALFLVLRRDFREFRRIRLFRGMLVYLAITVPWYLIACWRGGSDFTHEMLFKHNFGMFFKTWSHKRPLYYYFCQLPWMFLPWITFLPVAIVHLFKMRDRHREGILYLTVWAIATFAFFSLSEAKQQKYILPMFPTLAIMLGKLWADFMVGLQSRKWRVAMLVCAGIIAFIGVAVGISAPFVLHRFTSEGMPVVMPLSLLIILCSAAPFLFLMYKRRGECFFSYAIGILLISLYCSGPGVVLMNDHKSARSFCEEATEITGSDSPIGIYGISFRQTGAYVFYTGKRLDILEDNEGKPDEGKLADFLARHGEKFCIMKKALLEEFEQKHSMHMEVLLERKIGHRSVCLVRGPCSERGKN